MKEDFNIYCKNCDNCDACILEHDTIIEEKRND